MAEPGDLEKPMRDMAEAGPASSLASSGEDRRSRSPGDEKHLNANLKKAGDSPDPDHDPLGHLPEHERAVLKRQLDTPDVKVGFFTLFRFATRNDLLIIALSAVCGIAAGAVMPLMTIIFGQLAGVFQHFFLGQLSGSDFTAKLGHFTIYYVYLAIGEFITIYISTVGFIYAGEHITQKIREQYLAAVLRQNVGFFDKLGAGEITTRITADTNLVQDGISEKIALTLTAIATFVTAFVIAFIKYWLLTLILCSTVVAIVLMTSVVGKNIPAMSKKSIQAYAVGGTVAEEVLSSIRNAVAFGTEDKLAKQYDTHLQVAEHWAKRSKGLLGLMLGGLMCIVFMNYGLAFWQGSRFLVAGKGGITLQDILTILLAIMIGAFSLGNVAPNAQAFIQAIAAGAKIFATIDRKSPIDPADQNQGMTLRTVDGSLSLKNVKHIYPSRPEVVVMEDVSLDIPAGKTTALVGASGSGKSTVVGLALRLYDPVDGQVFLDGVDVRDLNVQFLRHQISLVGQEPTLFGTTILENICHGLIGTEHEALSDEKKMDLVIDAAKMANAHTFILELPEGYQTNVGQKGFLLSGGQKQRIAIARAVVSDPKILLLDEATSALDTKSEGVVQAALDKAAEGRTTITVAHRLSTIKHADNIVVMAEGRIVEQGTHDQLLERKAAYHRLVEAQQIAAATQKMQREDSEGEEELTLEKEASELKLTSSNNPRLTRTQTGKSVSSKVLGKESNGSKEEPKRYSLWTLMKLTTSLNRPEWGIMSLGLVSSIIAGAGQPVQSVFFAKSIVALSRPPSQYAQLRTDINFWAGMYLMLAFVQLFSHAGQGVAFAYASEKLIHRARDKAFRSMLRQDISFFDREENSAGALTTFLSTETTNLAGISGITLGTMLNVLTTLIASFVLSLAIGWKLALVCIATVPVVLTCGFLRFWVLGRLAQRSKSAYATSAAYACEATSAIRTVASLTREQDVWDHYHEQLEEQGKKSLRSVLKTSLLYAASQSFMFLAIALGFWYGGKLIGSGEYGLFQFFVCFSAVIFGAQSAGVIFSFAPDMSKSRGAASELKTLYERQPTIDTWSTAGKTLDKVEGLIEFRDVHFRYATRPEVPVLRGISLTVKPGEYVALVGASGCGKSTSVGLVERFYDPLSGTITLDGHDISTLNINSYRSHIALVSQEPTLYQGTIRENILLGTATATDSATISDATLETACRNANIWNFISSLPDGLGTDLGNKGVMLSGGQKQRVAIARALLRDPKVLLLDEATSALDSESEKVVQAALDQAAKGRTTISIAHRLSTIQRADRIYVFEGGRVVESGRHQQLLARRGRYWELVQMQSLERTA